MVGPPLFRGFSHLFDRMFEPVPNLYQEIPEEKAGGTDVPEEKTGGKSDHEEEEAKVLKEKGGGGPSARKGQSEKKKGSQSAKPQGAKVNIYVPT